MQDVEALFQKFLRGQCSRAEADRLLDYFSSPAGDEELSRLIETKLDTLSGADEPGFVVYSMAKNLDKLRRRINPVRRRPTIYRLLPYAAAAVLIMALATTWIFFREQLNLKSKIVNLTSEDILPGGNRATLTLADGTKIDLSEFQEGIVVGDEVTYVDGSPVWSDRVTERTSDERQSSQDHRITGSIVLATPKGGTYQVALPDGSKVWLNAASTLTYPSSFNGGERVVEITGEGYFAVAKDKSRPFKVISRGQEIAVLGTEFNVDAYPDEQETKTTLVEGSVKVVIDQLVGDGRASGIGHASSIALLPGEQAALRGTQLSKKTVSVQDAIAWREGKFSFNDKTFAEIMDELARWYDLEIVYERGIPQEELAGDAFRNQNLGLVLRVLDAVEIDYRLDAASRQLIIKGQNNRSRN